MTPLEIEVLLHIYYRADPPPRLQAPAVQSAIAWFRDLDLIRAGEDEVYKITSRGKAHINQLCALDIPTEAWAGSDGLIIKVE